MIEPLIVRREVQIAAPPATVFAFLTDPQKILRWMGTEATMDAIRVARAATGRSRIVKTNRSSNRLSLTCGVLLLFAASARAQEEQYFSPPSEKPRVVFRWDALARYVRAARRARAVPWSRA